jgi:hypothetical protein
MNAKRAVLRLQLDAGAKQHLDRLARALGMTQVSLMTRLIEWVMRQHEVIQYVAIGALTPELAAPLARELLEELAKSQPGRDSRPDAKS